MWYCYVTEWHAYDFVRKKGALLVTDPVFSSRSKPPNIIWDTLLLKHHSLFTWNSNWAEHSVFYLQLDRNGPFPSCTRARARCFHFLTLQLTELLQEIHDTRFISQYLAQRAYSTDTIIIIKSFLLLAYLLYYTDCGGINAFPFKRSHSPLFKKNICRLTIIHLPNLVLRGN